MTQIALITCILYISWREKSATLFFYGDETSQRRTLHPNHNQMYGANIKVYYLTGIVGGGGYAIQTVSICMRETEMYVQSPRVTVKLTPA